MQAVDILGTYVRSNTVQTLAGSENLVRLSLQAHAWQFPRNQKELLPLKFQVCQIFFGYNFFLYSYWIRQINDSYYILCVKSVQDRGSLFKSNTLLFFMYEHLNTVVLHMKSITFVVLKVFFSMGHEQTRWFEKNVTTSPFIPCTVLQFFVKVY